MTPSNDRPTTSETSRQLDEAGLRDLVASCMELPADELPGASEDLIDYGLHSIAIMQFASSCNRFGIPLEYGELAANPTLAAWWRLVADRQVGSPR